MAQPDSQKIAVLPVHYAPENRWLHLEDYPSSPHFHWQVN